MSDRKKLSVRYYRLHAMGPDGKFRRIGALPLPELLDGLRGRGGNEFDAFGSTYVLETRDGHTGALVIHKLRNQGEYMSRVGRDGTVSEHLAADDEGAYADTSCVLFLQNNIFGIVRGNGSAPTCNRVADWLNLVKPFALPDGVFIKAVPLRQESEWKQMGESDGIRSVEIEADLEILREIGVSVKADQRNARTVLPEASARIKLTFGRKRPRRDQYEAMKELVQSLEFSALGKASKASVSAVREVPAAKKNKTRLVSEELDLLNGFLATEFTVPMTGDGATIAA